MRLRNSCKLIIRAPLSKLRQFLFDGASPINFLYLVLALGGRTIL
jgi:hypothetical protein